MRNLIEISRRESVRLLHLFFYSFVVRLLRRSESHRASGSNLDTDSLSLSVKYGRKQYNYWRDLNFLQHSVGFVCLRVMWCGRPLYASSRHTRSGHYFLLGKEITVHHLLKLPETDAEDFAYILPLCVFAGAVSHDGWRDKSHIADMKGMRMSWNRLVAWSNQDGGAVSVLSCHW